MHSTGSILKTILAKVRFYLDEPEFDAKFSDDFLVRYFIYPAVINALARLNLNNDDPIVVRHSITLVEGQQYYQLPPTIQEVWRFCVMEPTTGRITADAYPRGEFNPFGPGWAIEGNLLNIRPFPNEGDTLQDVSIWYVPNGDILYHYFAGGSGLGTYDLGTNTFTLTASPSVGEVEKRPNAYAGSVLRILGTDQWEERIIDTHDVTTNTVVPRLAFDASLDAQTDIAYEIMPVWSSSLASAIALMVAMDVAVGRKVPESRQVAMARELRTHMKTIKDNLGNKQLRTGKAFNKNTVDNPERTWGTWTSWSYTQGP